jgi:hypothetical protein
MSSRDLDPRTASVRPRPGRGRAGSVAGRGPIMTGRRRGGWRLPGVSARPLLREVASRFSPPYEATAGAPSGIRLADPSGRRPDIFLSHRYERRLFLRANYLALSATVPGRGPATEAELVAKMRGTLTKQRATIGWKRPPPDGDEWLERLADPMLEASKGIEAVQLLRAAWSPKRAAWHLRVETMSGSMVSGMMAAAPIAVPFDQREANSFVALVDAFSKAAS